MKPLLCVTVTASTTAELRKHRGSQAVYLPDEHYARVKARAETLNVSAVLPPSVAHGWFDLIQSSRLFALVPGKPCMNDSCGLVFIRG